MVVSAGQGYRELRLQPASLPEPQGLLGGPPEGVGLWAILFPSVSLPEEWGL